MWLKSGPKKVKFDLIQGQIQSNLINKRKFVKIQHSNLKFDIQNIEIRMNSSVRDQFMCSTLRSYISGDIGVQRSHAFGILAFCISHVTYVLRKERKKSWVVRLLLFLVNAALIVVKSYCTFLEVVILYCKYNLCGLV